MNNTNKMTQGKPAALIMSFSFPLIIANLGQQLYMIVDSIIVGKGVGIEALAAVGATDWSYWLALWVVQSFTQGFSIPISQYFGEGSKNKVRQAITASIRLCLIIGAVMTILCLLIARPLLTLLQTPGNIFESAALYLLFMYGGILIITAYNMSAAILRALGDSRTPMLSIIVAAITNIVLDLLFVMRFHWGVSGAAAATVIAQFFAFLCCFLVLRRMEFCQFSREDWQLHTGIVKKLCRLGIPYAFQHMLIAIGGMILQSAINLQGVVFVAGFTATNKIFGLLESSAISIGHSVTTYMAQNYGAGQYNRIRQGLKSSLAFAVSLSILISAGMILSGRVLLSLFIDQTDPAAPEVLQVAYHYLFVVSCFLVFLYLLYIFRSTLLGLGKPFASLVSGVMEFIGRVSTARLFIHLWGANVVFYAEPAAWIAATVILITVCLRTIHQMPRT